MNPIVRNHLKWSCLLLAGLALRPGFALAQRFDHAYQPFSALLARHVKWNAAGTASMVDYAGFKEDREALGQFLATLSGVSRAQYDAFSRDQKLAFLINAYNAFTIELILTRYPDLESIKDIGGLFSGSPWKQAFFTLLGGKRHLDWVEHEMIRAPGVFDEPRIHFVVNCASIGCPALRAEAFVAERLEMQLEDSTRRFFSDRTRNHYDASSGKLMVTRLLDWYEADFTQGWNGVRSVRGFLARYAKNLSDDPAVQARIAASEVDYRFTDYDWKLNAA